MNSAIASSRGQGLSQEQFSVANRQNGKTDTANAPSASSQGADTLKDFVLALLRSFAVGAA